MYCPRSVKHAGHETEENICCDRGVALFYIITMLYHWRSVKPKHNITFDAMFLQFCDLCRYYIIPHVEMFTWDLIKTKSKLLTHQSYVGSRLAFLRNCMHCFML